MISTCGTSSVASKSMLGVCVSTLALTLCLCIDSGYVNARHALRTATSRLKLPPPPSCREVEPEYGALCAEYGLVAPEIYCLDQYINHLNVGEKSWDLTIEHGSRRRKLKLKGGGRYRKSWGERSNSEDEISTEWKVSKSVCFDQKHQFYFQDAVRRRAGNDSIESEMRVISGKPSGQVRVLKTMAARHIAEWVVCDTTLITRCHDPERVVCYDRHLRAISHPVLTIVEDAGLAFDRICGMAMHPGLPILLIEVSSQKHALHNSAASLNDGASLWLVRWQHPNESLRLVRLFVDSLSAFPNAMGAHYPHAEFSPDGRWCTLAARFRIGTDSRGTRRFPVYIATPIDTASPYLFGDAVVLGSVKSDVQGNLGRTIGSAWLTSPLRYVLADESVLYVWNLDSLPRTGFRERSVD